MPGPEAFGVDAETRAAQATTLYDLSCALCVACSLSELVEVVASYLVPLEAETCTLVLIEQESPEGSGWAQVAAAWPSGAGFPSGRERFSLGGSPLHGVLLSPDILIAEDVAQAEWLDARSRAALVVAGRMRAFSAPLLVRGRIIGQLLATWPSPRSFAPYEIRLMSTIAHQAPAVAERLQLLEKSQRQIEELDQLRRDLEQRVAELLTPIIPVAHDVVVMPLIGSIDRTRAQQVMEALLQGVAARGASTAILDVTGVPAVDTAVANALLQAAHAVQLIGASVIVTGVRPEMARTLAALGIDLGHIVLRSTVQDGIAFALHRRGRGS